MLPAAAAGVLGSSSQHPPHQGGEGKGLEPDGGQGGSKTRSDSSCGLQVSQQDWLTAQVGEVGKRGDPGESPEFDLSYMKGSAAIADGEDYRDRGWGRQELSMDTRVLRACMTGQQDCQRDSSR